MQALLEHRDQSLAQKLMKALLCFLESGWLVRVLLTVRGARSTYSGCARSHVLRVSPSSLSLLPVLLPRRRVANFFG